MGHNPRAAGSCHDGADCYVLRIKLGTIEPGGTQSSGAALIGQTIRVYIRQNGGPEEEVAQVVAQRGMIWELNLNVCHHATADYDCDGKVDLSDYALYFDCQTGPNQPPAPNIAGITATTCLSAFDDDSDGDVDLQDFAAFLGLVACPHTRPDYDCNGSVDVSDYAIFADCSSGPGRRPAPTLPGVTPGICLSAFDEDSDGDVDLRDFARFLNLAICSHHQADYDCNGIVGLTDHAIFADCQRGQTTRPRQRCPGSRRNSAWPPSTSTRTEMSILKTSPTL